MSNTDFNLATDSPKVDKSATIGLICEAETDLLLLKDYVATAHDPILPAMVVTALAGLHYYLHNFTPSHSRH